MATSKTKKAAVTSSKIKLIISDDANPSVNVKAGQKLEVISVAVVTPDLKKGGPIAARLCGGTSTCLALVEL